MPAQARYKKVEGSCSLLLTLFPQLTPLFGKTTTAPRYPLATAIGFDLLRTRVVLCHPQDRSRFDTAWQEPAILSYTQLVEDLTAPEPDPEILKQVEKDAKTGVITRNPKAMGGILTSCVLVPAAGAALFFLGPIAAGGALLTAALTGAASTRSLVVHERKHREKINQLIVLRGSADERDPLLGSGARSANSDKAERRLSPRFDPPDPNQPQAVAAAARHARERSGLFSTAEPPTDGRSPCPGNITNTSPSS